MYGGTSSDVFTNDQGEQIDLVAIVFIPDMYTFRSSLEILSCVKTVATFRFSKDKFSIEEMNDSRTRGIKLTFYEEELLEYQYCAEYDDGLAMSHVDIPISIAKIVKSTKQDGKKGGLLFHAYVKHATLEPEGIILLKNKASSSASAIRLQAEKMDNYNETVYDYDKYFIEHGICPSAKKTTEELATALKTFKNGSTRVIFCKSEEGPIHLKDAMNNTSVFLNKSTGPRIDGTAILPEDSPLRGALDVGLSITTIDLMIRLYKLGAKNVARIYMYNQFPMVIVASIGSYGTCMLLLNDDPI